MWDGVGGDGGIKNESCGGWRREGYGSGGRWRTEIIM